jgi:hypothetical protein
VRNLVIAPAGERSLHHRWMGDPATRSYDVWLLCYEDASLASFTADPVRTFDARGTMKWPGISRVLQARAPEVAGYDAVWFPDDDLAIDAPEVERLFATFHALDLWLAQPALADGSYFSAALTLRCAAFVARFTNFVEVMAPILSREALRRLAPTFGESISGWGLDRIWPVLLGEPRDRVAVIDAVSLVHTHPVESGSWYAALAERPRDEADRLCARYGVPLPFAFRQYGGIPAEAGPRRDAIVPAGGAFLWRLVRGAPPSQRLRGWFWRRQWRSVRAGARALGASGPPRARPVP